MRSGRCNFMHFCILATIVTDSEDRWRNRDRHRQSSEAVAKGRQVNGTALSYVSDDLRHKERYELRTL